MIQRLSIITIAILITATTAFASVTDTVRKTVDDVITIVSNKEMKKKSNEHKRRVAIKKAIASVFDSEEMARRTLGKHWNQRSPQERKQFVELFATLLENSYAKDWKRRTTYPVLFYQYGGHVIWGLTARVLFGFLNVCRSLK